jgi:hypothetical protein
LHETFSRPQNDAIALPEKVKRVVSRARESPCSGYSALQWLLEEGIALSAVTIQKVLRLENLENIDKRSSVEHRPKLAVGERFYRIRSFTEEVQRKSADILTRNRSYK